jgi:hypothetical protein
METWLYGILFVGSVVAVAMGGGLLVRRSASLEFLESHNEVAGFIYAVVGVIYAVLLAFVVAFVWEQHRTAEASVEQEANQLGDLFRDTEAFPARRREVLQASIRSYVQMVTENEWEAMARGEPSPEAWRAYNLLWSAYVEFVPATEHQRIWYIETIGDLNEMGDYRRLRLLSSHATVPSILWVTIIVGAIVTIGFGYFFGTKSLQAHLLMVCAVSGTISLTLFVVFALDHPFRGLAPVEPDAFEQLLNIFDTFAP